MAFDRDTIVRAEAALSAAERRLNALLQWGGIEYATEREFAAETLGEVKTARAELRAALWPRAIVPVLQSAE